MIISGPGLGIIPNWQFSTNPGVNPNINPFIKTPAGAPPLAGHFGSTVVDRSLGFVATEQMGRVPGRAGGRRPGRWWTPAPQSAALGYVMVDHDPAKYGFKTGLAGAGSWAWDHKGEIAIVGGVLGVAGIVAWLLA